MSNLKYTFHDYLARVGYFDEIRLGDEPPQRAATDEESRRMAAVLDARLKVNRYLIFAILGALSLVFGLAVYFLVHYRNDPKAMYGVFGVLLLSNYGVIRWLRQLWWEANVMDASLYVLRKMPADQAAAFINRLYWDFLQASSERHRRLNAKQR